jgi:hypothetical protein
VLTSVVNACISHSCLFTTQVHLVIDLTNSYRYYDFGHEFSQQECTQRQIAYVKVRAICKWVKE